jgi:hypothetical protein
MPRETLDFNRDAAYQKNALGTLKRAASGAGRKVSYFQLSDGPNSRSSLSRTSRTDFQCSANWSGPAFRKSNSTTRRQKRLRPLSQVCPSGGKRSAVDSSGVFVISLKRASFHALTGSKSSTDHPIPQNVAISPNIGRVGFWVWPMKRPPGPRAPRHSCTRCVRWNGITNRRTELWAAGHRNAPKPALAWASAEVETPAAVPSNKARWNITQ